MTQKKSSWTDTPNADNVEDYYKQNPLPKLQPKFKVEFFSERILIFFLEEN